MAASYSSPQSSHGFSVLSPPRELDFNELLAPPSPPSPPSCSNKRRDWLSSASSYPSETLFPEFASAIENSFASSKTSSISSLPFSAPSTFFPSVPRLFPAALRLSDVAAALESIPDIARDTPTTLSAFDLHPFPKHDPPVPLLSVFDELLQKPLRRCTALRPPRRAPQRPRQTGRTSSQLSSTRKSKGLASLGVENRSIAKDPVLRREIHIHSERQRREGMTHLYATLHSLLPEGKLKTDRCSVLTETAKHIRSLRLKLEELGIKKAEVKAALEIQKSVTPTEVEQSSLETSRPSEDMSSMEQGEGSSELSEAFADSPISREGSVRFFGREAFITINTPKKKGIWSGIMQILEDQSVEVMNATLSRNPNSDFHSIHAKIPKSAAELSSHDLERILQVVLVAVPENSGLDQSQ